MDRHIKEFYYGHFDDDSSANKYHDVIPLHEAQDISWKEIIEKIPSLPRGWYELASLKSKDRIEFICNYWESKLPYRANLCAFIDRFFASLDDVGIFVVQKKWADPYFAEIVYSIKDNDGFYRGALPATDLELNDLATKFPGFIFPKDYLAFLEIHNGWWKTTDATGVMPSSHMYDAYLQFQALTKEDSDLPTIKGAPVDPKKLIPFYESFGMPYFQCFWADWYPEDEMGNVYYSSDNRSISAFDGMESSPETMAFPTFCDWLMFYLERVE